MNLTKFDVPLLRAAKVNRKPGIHLTDIMKRMAQDGRLKNWPDYQGLSPEDQQKYEDYFFWPGFLWEEVLSKVYSDRECGWANRPDEIEVDRVIMSPDGIFSPEQLSTLFGIKYAKPAIGEYKWTSSYSDKYPDHNSKTNWIIQTKSYCYAAGLNAVVFIVCYSRGMNEWEKLQSSTGEFISIGPQPEPAGFLVKYSQEELIENWAEVLRYRDVLIAEGFYNKLEDNSGNSETK